jgi:hypothetical protein
LPFHLSAKVFIPVLALMSLPTAMQAVARAHDTPLKLLRTLDGLTGFSSDQVLALAVPALRAAQTITVPATQTRRRGPTLPVVNLLATLRTACGLKMRMTQPPRNAPNGMPGSSAG